MNMGKPFIIGNWKMNGLSASIKSLALPVARHVAERKSRCTVVLCPPAPLIGPLYEVMQSVGIEVGGQDCSAFKEGAYTGETSAALLKELGALYCIVGHSERRQYHKETSELVAKKALVALEQKLIPIICVGETQAERDAGKEREVIETQVKASIPDTIKSQILVAYEPVWAIGTGRTATVADIEVMHRYLRGLLPDTPLLYGGSVKASNAREILGVAEVDGVLVGGASLVVEEFSAIIDAAG